MTNLYREFDNNNIYDGLKDGEASGQPIGLLQGYLGGNKLGTYFI
ncbi:hypothetical protein [Cytobacillus praedii]|nr:hypothetical protein [Cytobacillus praedii]